MDDNKVRKKNRGKRGLLYKLLALIFCAVILMLAFISLVLPDKEYSEEENRVLAEFPEISLDNILDTKFMTGLESYTSDHFVGRDAWINLKVRCDLLLGKTELNGVYLCDDDYLIQIPANPNQESVDNNLNAINEFAGKNKSLNINMMIVPNAISVMDDYLPLGAPARDQREDAKRIQKVLDASVDYIDVSAALKNHIEEGMYYKTDHHWTSHAAYYAFMESAEQMEITEPITEYDKYLVTSDFSGTLASTSGYHNEKDEIWVYDPVGIKNDYLVTDSSGSEPRTTVYDKSALSEKDKYQLFFGGNQSKVEISTLNKTERKLLVFKDSYANCFVPFLIPYYNEIIMVDPRYYYDDVHTLIDRERITDVLFLYNMDTFLSDTSLADVVATE
ncbi:MAG: DHHW family protein [Schaedlerella sp.]|nr:DHHW family protein [Schaedlerella sp.]